MVWRKSIVFKVCDKLSPPTYRILNKNTVFLTFDDGPSEPYTTQILDILDSTNFTATFFLTGMQVERYPKVTHEVIRRGHTVGSHSYSHVNGAKSGVVKTLIDFIRGHRCVTKTVGHKVKYFRPPYGVHGFSSRVFCFFFRVKPILWCSDSLDWESGMRPSAIVENSLLEPGAIVLFHDWIMDLPERCDRSNTVKAIEEITIRLKARNFKSSGL